VVQLVAGGCVGGARAMVGGDLISRQKRECFRHVDQQHPDIANMRSMICLSVNRRKKGV
jgi:hypothetical protein